MNARGIIMPAIFISGRAEVATAVAAFKAGSLDFLEKPFEVVTLRRTVEHAVKRDVELRADRLLRIAVAERVASLTRREREVMRLVVDGLRNKAIAAELCVSPKTVEVHRARVMQKMQADSLPALVRFALLHRDGRTG